MSAVTIAPATRHNRVAARGESIVRMAATDFAPFAIALIPFSLAIGMASALNGLSLAQAGFGALFLIAGTSQLAAAQLIGSDASAVVVVATVILINARFIVYGAGLARWFADVPLRQRLALAIPLVDQSFLCCEERFETLTGLRDRRRYYCAGTAMLLSVFMGSQLVGYLVGPSVPDWLGLQLAAPLAFAGMLVKSMRTKQHVTAGVAAAFAVIVCAGLPAGSGLSIAIGVGLLAGARTEEERP